MLEKRWQDQHLFIKAFEDSPIGMAFVSPGGKFMKVNQSICKMLGYSENELINLTFQDVSYPEELKINLELRAKSIAGEIDSYRLEKKYIHKSGEVIWGLLSVTVERDDKGELLHFISQIVDITEQKIKEEKIRESEKLSMVGQLAAGIAHEIRNPLTCLRGFVQVILNEDSEKKTRYKVMLAEIDRINEIVSELLVLAKPATENFGFGSVSCMLDHVVTLLEAHAKLYNVEIKKYFEADLPLIKCHSSLKQVFINMTKNAIESMPDGGELRIEVKKLIKSISINFVDNGCGIPGEVLQKIGQPFFTTKESGTGLGIMVSKGIIQNHNGIFDIRSTVGKGTTIEIILPAI
ncbi:PAS domain S-box protein [Paenibacillus aestuarii]|uniref:histidine kinase n=1 Tax=Paenibacillus aestuarii TaxID=516965 RepID=A0ABW0KB83_9BACL|nr:PAS domain S-box protein [Paenibacillus aestuarii]